MQRSARRRLSALVLAAVLMATPLSTFSPAAGAEVIVLRGDAWTVQIDTESLQVTAQPHGKGTVQVSAPQEGLGAVKQLEHSERHASWELAEKGLRVSFRLDDDTLSAHFLSRAPGRFTWPICGNGPGLRAYILPLFEGSYVPADHAEWLAFLTKRSPMSTTEGLSMPFWGLDCGGNTLTYMLTNPFNNELAFEDHGGRIAVRLTHEFTTNRQTKEYGLLIRLGKASPVEPAKQYRRWLIERGQFVSLRDKIKRVPDVEKLLGAAHIYLWGSALISRHDVLDWQRFPTELAQQGRAPRPSPGKRIWELMDPQVRETLAEAASLKRPYAYMRREIANELSELLQRRDFYEESAWQGIQPPAEALELLKKGVGRLSEPQLRRLNCLLLEAAFRDAFVRSDLWGDGVSVKMMDKFAQAGFDRLWLGLNSWQGGFNHPRAIKRAKDLGYLIATYDSYHSVHHPEEADTWPTAQFDLQLYQTGAVVRADGARRPGFKRKGYALSPIAARPYVEKRVADIMDTLAEPFNSWFIDCDAYGQLFDDYSELHPATQQDDMNARLERMAWIRDAYALVIGSEAGAAYSAPVIHYAHGMMTPVVGWGDPDLRKDKESKYFLGRWWPPDGPAVFVKQVPLKQAYYTTYYDPRFRLPLYQTVFHDSVVTTHHWGYGSLKFKDQADTVELLELLYNVPPLYHMNLDEFEKHKARMKAHYDFFSLLHRESALLPLTDFAWLTSDRMVQRTVFGDRVEMVANFAEERFDYGGTLIPGRSILARRLDTGDTQVFTPAPLSGTRP